MNKFDFTKCNYFIFFANKQVEVLNIPLQEIEKNIDVGLAECPQNIKLLQMKMQIQYKYNNDNYESLKTSKQILEIDPQNIDARLDIVFILLVLGVQFESVQQLIDECLQIDDTYWRIYYSQCCRYMYEEDFVKAQYFLAHYQIKYPDNPWISILLAQILIDYPSTQERAKELLEQTMKFSKFDYDLLLRICCVVDIVDNNDDQSELIMKQALTLNPKSPKAHNNYGYFQRQVKDNQEECIKSCLTAVNLDKNNDDAYINLGVAHYSKQLFYESEMYFEKCISVNKFYQQAYQYIIYMNEKDLDNLDKSIYQALKFMKKFPFECYGKYRFKYSIKKDKELIEISLQELINQIYASGKQDDEFDQFAQYQSLNYFIEDQS